jgi:hypothetical protein
LHLDGNDEPNNYEAALFCYQKYFAIGVNSFDTPKEVVKGAFGDDIWWMWLDGANTDQKCDIDKWIPEP